MLHNFSPQKIEEEYFVIYFKNLVLPWYKKKNRQKQYKKGKLFFMNVEKKILPKRFSNI